MDSGNTARVTLQMSDSENISGLDLGWNSGGNILLDVITLRDGTLLVVSEELIALYKDWEAYHEGKVLGEILRPTA